MTLGQYQEFFAISMARLITQAYAMGYRVRLGEAYRPPEMAEIYAERGTGIKNSSHCEKLAIDLNLFKGGEFLNSTEGHRPLGEWWEEQHCENRWGGRFGDGNHYEMVPGYTNKYWRDK